VIRLTGSIEAADREIQHNPSSLACQRKAKVKAIP